MATPDRNLNSLVSSVRDLRRAIEDNTKRLERSEEDLENEKTWRRRVVALTVITFILSVFVGVGWYTNRQILQRSEDTISRVNVLQQDALCPLFGLFIGVYNPDAVPEGERAEYMKNFEIIFHISEVLNCGTPIPEEARQ